MRKILFLAVFLLSFVNFSWAYDFSSVAPSGQTLYYTISGSNATVTYPSVTNIGDGFTTPSGSLTIPDTVSHISQTYRVTSIGDYAFYVCSGLTSVSIPSSVTTIGEHAFDGCQGLTGITIPDSVISIGQMCFYGCTCLTHVSLGKILMTMSVDAFSYCTNVNTLFYNARNLTTNSNWYQPFYSAYCYGFQHMGLTLLVIGDSVQFLPPGVFFGQSQLTSVTIPNSVIGLGSYAFCGCSNLTSVTLGNSLSSIGSFAFMNCSRLANISLPVL